MVNEMADYGILVDYEWCTGCHTCETACQMINNLPPDQFGIKVNEIGPWKYGEDRWVLCYIPVPTDQCNLCLGRIEKGELPSCQKHCQASCLTVGPIDELADRVIEKKKQVLFHK